MKKRFSSFLLACTMLFGLCVPAFAADDEEYTAQGEYDAGVVTVTSDNLEANKSYDTIAVLNADKKLAGMNVSPVTANGSGSLSTQITVGKVDDVTGWFVYIYNRDGTAAAWGPVKEKEIPDATLSALTYTVNGGSSIAVSGFNSTKTTYSVTLPASTPKDAAIVLTGTASNPGASVTSGNVTLSNGKGTATVVVTAQDGTTTKPYTVNFTVASDTPVNPPVTTRYTIRFSAGEGTGTMSSVKQDKAASGNTSCTLPACTFTAPKGKVFDKWTVTGTGLTISGNTLTIASTVPANADIIVTATWKAEAADEYTIKFAPGEGTGTMNSATQAKAADGDTTFTLPVCTFTAPKGKVFDKWTVTGTGLSISGNTLTIASTVDADADITVTATWKEEQTPVVTEYTITASAGTGGSISPSGSVKVAEGGSQTFTVTANYNYVVSSVTVDGSAVSLTGGRYTFSNVTANHTISVTFRYVGGGGGGGGGSSSGGGGGGSSSSSGYSISVPSRVTGGSVTVRPTSASRGDKVTITAKPNSGYEVESVTVTDRNGDRITVTTEGNNKYTFIMPGSKVDVKVEFVRSQTTPSTVTFTDVSTGDWFYSAVQYAQQKGLMSGVGNSRFDPSSNLSRAQLAQILYNASGNPAAGANRFTDVPAGQWYTNAVSWAAQSGIVSGYGDGKFGPNDNITREQLAVMLWRYAGQPTPRSTSLSFTDANQVSSYAVQAMRWAVENGIISGYGEGQLAPRGLATRAQVASMLMRYMER